MKYQIWDLLQRNETINLKAREKKEKEKKPFPGSPMGEKK